MECNLDSGGMTGLVVVRFNGLTAHMFIYLLKYVIDT